MNENSTDRISVAQVLADQTGRSVEEFEAPEDIPYPDLSELTAASAEEYYESNESRS